MSWRSKAAKQWDMEIFPLPHPLRHSQFWVKGPGWYPVEHPLVEASERITNDYCEVLIIPEKEPNPKVSRPNPLDPQSSAAAPQEAAPACCVPCNALPSAKKLKGSTGFLM